MRRSVRLCGATGAWDSETPPLAGWAGPRGWPCTDLSKIDNFLFAGSLRGRFLSGGCPYGCSHERADCLLYAVAARVSGHAAWSELAVVLASLDREVLNGFQLTDVAVARMRQIVWEQSQLLADMNTDGSLSGGSARRARRVR